MFCQRWDGKQFSSKSFPWDKHASHGMRDREGAKMPPGEHPAFHWNRFPRTFILTFLSRFVKQWVLVWNGYDGRIYISSSPTLADRVFEPARVLVEKANGQEKNW